MMTSAVSIDQWSDTIILHIHFHTITMKSFYIIPNCKRSSWSTSTTKIHADISLLELKLERAQKRRHYDENDEFYDKFAMDVKNTMKKKKLMLTWAVSMDQWSNTHNTHIHFHTIITKSFYIIPNIQRSSWSSSPADIDADRSLLKLNMERV